MDPLFFFGAGSSARFGIPTMKEMVGHFKDELSKQSGKDIDEEGFLSVGLVIRRYSIPQSQRSKTQPGGCLASFRIS